MAWVESFITSDLWTPLGFAASAVGAILTIYFSIKASNSATEAKTASEKAALATKKTIIASEVIRETQRLQGIISGLKNEVKKKNWVECAVYSSDAYLVSVRLDESMQALKSNIDSELISEISTQALKLETEFNDAAEKKLDAPPVKIHSILSAWMGNCIRISEKIGKLNDK